MHNSPSDTRANHTRSELDIDRSPVWLVSQFKPKLPVEPLQVLRLRILQRRADVAQRVDHGVNLGVGDHGRGGSADQLGLRGGPLRLRLVDRIGQSVRVDPAAIASWNRPSLFSASAIRFFAASRSLDVPPPSCEATSAVLPATTTCAGNGE
jgi:hypothetical protein